MTRAALLWLLLGLFVFRVAGQFVVSLGLAPVLPPMDAWYSGFIPYGPLLATQLAIVALLARICLDMTRGRGYFAQRRAWLGSPIRAFGWFYASSMAVRYTATMVLYPERRWTGGTIPIVFHLVLATFLLVLADHHRRRPVDGRRDY